MVGCDICKLSCVECYKKQKQRLQEQKSKCSFVLESFFPYFLVLVIAVVIIILTNWFGKSWKWYHGKLFDKEKALKSSEKKQNNGNNKNGKKEKV